jgi:hypothetical protein
MLPDIAPAFSRINRSGLLDLGRREPLASTTMKSRRVGIPKLDLDVLMIGLDRTGA